MTNKSNARTLCTLDEITDGGSKGMTVATPSGEAEIFLVRQGQSVYAYENHCPHTGVPLNWNPDEFLDVEGKLIQCAMHGALFRIEDGSCIHGPCLGNQLQTVPVVIEDNCVKLAR